MIVTVYPYAQARKPAAVKDLEWPAFCAEVERLSKLTTTAPKSADEETQKKALPGIAPHRLKKGQKRRLLENVEAVTAIVLDVDDGATPEAVAARLKKAGVRALLYGSPRDSDAQRKFRVIVPTTKEIDPAECPETRRRLAELAGLGPAQGIERAIDAAKLFFVGRLHGTAPRFVQRVAGKPIDPDTLPPTRLDWRVGKAAKNAKQTASRALPAATAGIAAALGDWSDHDGHKWDLCGAVGGLLRRMGYSPQQCEAEIRAWLPEREPGVDVDAGVRWALGAWAKPASEVSGDVAAIVGDAHAAAIERAADAGSFVGAAPKRARLVADAATSDDPLGAEFDWTGPVPKIEYYCEGLRLAPSKGKVSIIGGLPGAGKGPLASYLALCFSLGLPAFGQFACRESRVLLLDCEGMALTAERISRMAKAIRRKPRELAGRLSLRDASGLTLLDPDFFRALQKTEPEVVILDSYTSAMMTVDADPNKPEYAKLAHAFAQLGCLVIAVAHGRKIPMDQIPTLQDIAGSGAVGAMAATGISCHRGDPKSPDYDPNKVTVSCMRAPRDHFAPFDVTFSDVAFDGLALEMTGHEEKAASARAEASGEFARVVSDVFRVFWRAAGVPRSIAHTQSGVTGNNGQIKDAVLALEKAGFLTAQDGARGTVYELAHDAPEAVRVTAAGVVAAESAPAVAVGGRFRPKPPRGRE